MIWFLESYEKSVLWFAFMIVRKSIYFAIKLKWAISFEFLFILKFVTKKLHAQCACRLENLLAQRKKCMHLCKCALKTCGATRNPEFPRTRPDRTETGPGSGNIFKNIFGSGRVGEFYFGSVRVGVFFFPGYETFSPGISRINLPFIPKLRK